MKAPGAEPYNPHADGELACLWELMRRSQRMRQFEQTVKELPSPIERSLPTVWGEFFLPLPLGIREVLLSYAFYLAKGSHHLSDQSWRNLPQPLQHDFRAVWGGERMKKHKGSIVKSAGRTGAAFQTPVIVANNLFTMDRERQRSLLGKLQFAGYVPMFIVEGPFTKDEFRAEMEQLWDRLPEHMKMPGQTRQNRFGTFEQWEKFLTFERITARNGFGRGKALNETIKKIKGGADDGTLRAYERDFTHAIEFIEGLIESVLSSVPPPVRPENRKRRQGLK